MYWTERHLFACTGNHCNQKGAANVINRLRFELMRRKLTDRIHMNTCGTIDLCDVGPNLVVYPDNIVLSNLKESDIPAIVKFLQGEELPTDLVMNAETPAEERRRRVYAKLQEAGNRVNRAEMLALAEGESFDDAWIEEQLRRGFMSKKPDEERGEDVYAMTSKASHRYRLA